MQFGLSETVTTILVVVSSIALIFPLVSTLIRALSRFLTSFKREANVRLVITKRDGERFDIKLEPNDEASIREALARLKTEGILEPQSKQQ